MDWLTPNVSYITEHNDMRYSKIIPKNNYLTMLALEDGFQAKFSGNAVEYKIDSGEWTTLASNTYTPTVNAGQRIYFKANLTPSSNNGIGKFVTYYRYNLEGNCMSMLYGDEAKGKTDLTGKDYAFRDLFSGNAYLVEVESDFLPATTLARSCYNQMFNGCTSLVTAPELPATTLTYDCYSSMFWNCTSLVNAPELPATTLATSAYTSMFAYCTSLTTAPELPATTLDVFCYRKMFNGCSNLNNITMLATDISAINCLANWVNSVSSTGTFTKAASMTSLSRGSDGIPYGWEVKDYVA